MFINNISLEFQFVNCQSKIFQTLDLEFRIAQLEERLTWLQKHVTEQDRVINSQSIEIKKLAGALLVLRNRFPDQALDGDERDERYERDASDERPPHY